jgi:predicted enzyme related to lactoylglutathione lyase
MTRVTGVGGIFFKSRDPDTLREWYRKHLELPIQDWGGVSFRWREADQPEREGATAWSIFPASSKYFDPSSSPFMINYRVANLAQVLEQLRSEGCQVDEKVDESEFGKFGWVMDPEGNRIELWEPPPGKFPG